MIKRCMKKGCKTKLGVYGNITGIVSVFLKKKWINVYLCRSHFLESDSMRADELIKWLMEVEE